MCVCVYTFQLYIFQTWNQHASQNLQVHRAWRRGKPCPAMPRPQSTLSVKQILRGALEKKKKKLGRKKGIWLCPFKKFNPSIKNLKSIFYSKKNFKNKQLKFLIYGFNKFIFSIRNNQSPSFTESHLTIRNKGERQRVKTGRGIGREINSFGKPSSYIFG